jgi:hypothetical protein
VKRIHTYDSLKCSRREGTEPAPAPFFHIDGRRHAVFYFYFTHHWHCCIESDYPAQHTEYIQYYLPITMTRSAATLKKGCLFVLALSIPLVWNELLLNRSLQLGSNPGNSLATTSFFGAHVVSSTATTETPLIDERLPGHLDAPRFGYGDCPTQINPHCRVTRPRTIYCAQPTQTQTRTTGIAYASAWCLSRTLTFSCPCIPFTASFTCTISWKC